jgi:CheY-like chemotaxis protein
VTKPAPSGSVTVRFRYAPKSGRMSFRIVDTGPGLVRGAREKLFQRFSQVDSSIRREFGGTGLGLAISRRLVEQMGGEIGFESLEGRGSTFWFEVNLPVAPMDDRTLVQKRADLQPQSRGRILLVEDNEINQEIARGVLQAAGHEVDVASDGIEAIAAVQAKTYDLVLMDVQMPGMDGITATKTIRVLPHAARDLPILAMTANVLPQQVEEFRAAGMDDHVGKPFRRDELHLAIDRWLGRRSAHPVLQGSRRSTSRGEGDATCPPERAPSEAS